MQLPSVKNWEASTTEASTSAEPVTHKPKSNLFFFGSDQDELA